jgi:mRNA interferase YafQ
MARLDLEFTSRFQRDYKIMARRRDVTQLHAVFDLIAQNDLASRDELIRRHNMHRLSGKWGGSNECHVANAEDWLVIWRTEGETAYFQRTGSHDELFR